MQVNKGKKCYNNGINNKYFNPEIDIIPDDFVPGEIKSKKNKHFEWYTNNTGQDIKIYTGDSIPDEYWLGRTEFSDEWKKHNGESHKLYFKTHPEARERSMEITTNLWKDPEYRNKTYKAQCDSWTPERREAISIWSKSQIASPELCEIR